jgi:hypothetical protein
MFAKRLFYVCAQLRPHAPQSPHRGANILSVVMRAVVTVPFLAGLLSCAAHRVAAPGDAKLEAATETHRIRVAGYTMKDGSYHRFDGYVTHTADSLVFVQPAGSGRLAAATPQRVSLSQDQVQSVKLVQGVSLTRSVLFGLSLLAFLALGWAIVGGNLISPLS